MRDLPLDDPRKARLFRNAQSREQAGLLPITDTDNHWQNVPALRGRTLREFWDRNFVPPPVHTLASTYQSRMLAAWRLVRQMSICRGALEETDPIEMAGHAIAWHNSEFRSFKNITSVTLRRVLTPGVSLLPPDVPPEWTDDRQMVKKEYVPTVHDPKLMNFVRAQVVFGRAYLNLAENPKTCAGFQLLTDPDFVRVCWPSEFELVHFETNLVNEAAQMMIRPPFDTPDPRVAIAKRWGLSPKEVQQVTSLAMASLVVQQRISDIEGHKALSVSRLEAMLPKMEEANDYRGMAVVVREINRIINKSNTDGEESLEDMTKVVAISASDRRKQISLSDPLMDDPQ